MARRWATAEPPPKEGNSIAEQCAGLGLPEDGAFEDAIKEAIKEEQAEQAPIEVWEENWDAVAVFLGCATQWRMLMPPMGGALIHEGLIYSGVRDVIWAYGHTGQRAREIFGDVQVMEATSLRELRQRAEWESS